MPPSSHLLLPSYGLRNARGLERSGEHPCALGDGIGISRHAGLERQLHPVLVLIAIARDHVQVEVENGLPGFGTAAVEQVDAVGAEFGEQDSGDPLGRQNRGRLSLLVGPADRRGDRAFAQDRRRGPASIVGGRRYSHPDRP